MNFTFKEGDVRGALASDVDLMAKAATGAVADTGRAALTASRANVASAGFSAAWQNSMQLRLYPASGVALSPAALVFSRIRYSEIFQTGGTIAGHPELWLPIAANLPGGSKWTPSKYVQQVGPLMSVNVPGKPPMLFARNRRGPPLFVGVSQVTLRKRLNVDEAVALEAARLPDRYAERLKD